MDGLTRMLSIEPVLFCPVNNGREGNPLVVGTLQSVFNVAIVVSSYRNIGIVNQCLINSKLFEDMALNDRRDASGFLMSGLDNRKTIGVFPVFLQKHKKPRLPNAQHLLNIGSVHLMVNVSLNELFDLMIGKPRVHLCHTQKPPSHVFE